MAKPEWGTKRVCKSCAAKFYDLKRSPILCPKCGAKFDPEALLKSRRPRTPAAAKAIKPAKEVPSELDDREGKPKDEDDIDAVIGDVPEIKDDDGDDDTLLADTSDLDEDDVVAVVKPGGSKDDT